MQTGIENNHGQRRSGFELLRILAALGVLALHYNDSGVFDGLSKQVNLLVLNLNECFWAWPVDVFLMLSGYFSFRNKRVSLKKPAMLYVQLVVFRLLGSLIGALKSGSGLAPGKLLACFLPLNYFVVLFIAVYLISPWLNALYNCLDRDAKRRMILCLFAVFSLWAYAGDLLSAAIGLSMNFASPVSISGDISGHTVVNFALCYLIGAAIADDVITLKRPLPCFFAATAATMLFCLANGDDYVAISYCSPFVILQAVSLMCFFRTLDIGCVKWINMLGGASLSVYLTQIYLFGFFGRERFMWSRPYVLLAHILVSQISIYLVGFLVHIAYTGLTTPIFDRIWRKQNVDTEVS